jgi:hypothetical protein
MLNNTDALHEGLKKILNYLPMIYNQRNPSSTWDGNITIRYPYKEIPNNAILFVLPLYNSLDNTLVPNINKLTIQYATVSQDGKEISYQTSKTYNIVIESQDGSKRPATIGDIIANKLCMFRFISNNKKDIVLCNNPIYNNLQCSSLYITNESKFRELPIYEYQTTINGVVETVQTPLATAEEVLSLKERLTKLENRLQIGVDSPEDFFTNNPNLPDNTIYFQTEE